MQDTAKYLIHADITTDGVVERSDVVGAIFGQTEGLLGDELDLRELQDSSKVGRIDVDVDSQNGQSFGRVTIATSLDQVETAILAASLETIERVGPCRSTLEIRSIEDVRTAKRREVVERAKILLGEAFDGSMLSSRDLIAEVREAVRVEDITEYEGLPAGPRVVDSDAVIIVEGRADVLTLLRYGVKNAIAVEGTNVPDAVATLTTNRTVTAFLDGDRGGELILKELAQVGEVDYVAFAPEGRSVEDLARHEVMLSLREKVPYERVADIDGLHTRSMGELSPSSSRSDDGSEDPKPGADEHDGDGVEVPLNDDADTDADTPGDVEVEAADDGIETENEGETVGDVVESETTDGTVGDDAEPEGKDGAESTQPETLRGHVDALVGSDSGRARLLDAEFQPIAEGDAADAFDLIAEAETIPSVVVIDGELSQRVLDIAAQRGVGQVVVTSTGEFVKRPTSVRVRTASQLQQPTEA